MRKSLIFLFILATAMFLTAGGAWAQTNTPTYVKGTFTYTQTPTFTHTTAPTATPTPAGVYLQSYPVNASPTGVTKVALGTSWTYYGLSCQPVNYPTGTWAGSYSYYCITKSGYVEIHVVSHGGNIVSLASNPITFCLIAIR